MITFTILSGSEAGTTATFESNSLVIGRGSACDLVLSDKSVSRRHCTIQRQGDSQSDGFIVIDLHSANHTFLNDDLSTPITVHVLHTNDELTVGKIRIRIQLPPAAEAQETDEETHPQHLGASPAVQEDEQTQLAQSIARTSPAQLQASQEEIEEAEEPAAAAVKAEEFVSYQALTAVRQPSVPIVLIVVSGPDRGQVYAPAQEVFSLGRAQTCEIVLHDQQVSRRHASIKREGGHYRLYDENSRNGTYLGMPSEQVFVASGRATPVSSNTMLTVDRQSIALHTSQRDWLLNLSPQESGLIFGHAAHAESAEDEDISCVDCHTGQAGGSMSLPTHATCITCHDEVGDSDPQAAKRMAKTDTSDTSNACLMCHTQPDEGQDIGIARLPDIERVRSAVSFQHVDHIETTCQSCHFVIETEDDYQPVVRSAKFYPVPMEECFACHEKQQATLACLDCHRQHHSYPAPTQVTGGWLSTVTLEGVLSVCVGLVFGAGTYTYFNTRLARRWLASLAHTPTDEGPSEPADAVAGGVPPPTPERKRLFSADLECRDDLDTEEFPPGLRQLFEAHSITLSENLAVAVQTTGNQWLITDQDNGQPYRVTRADQQLTIYEEGKILPYPIVDLDRCIACHGCYDSCPKHVLAGDPISSKSTVIDPGACTASEDGCTICQNGCPTDAIRVTTARIAKQVERPHIDAHQESNIPGLFLAGEVVGAALIKKAINQGDTVVRYIHTNKPRLADVAYDVIIVGSGPAGLGAALEAKRLGLRYLLLERGTVASTIRDYPRDKAVLAEPVRLPVYGLLPMMDLHKEDLVAAWEQIVQEQGIQVNEREEVTAVHTSHAAFIVHTAKDTYQGSNVILAIGTRGIPRKLGVPGEELSKVAYNLVDAAEFQAKKVLIVGGGDSAVEAAVALAKETGTTVHLAYRKSEFSRIRSRNADALAEQVQAGRLTLMLNSNVQTIIPTTVTLHSGGQQLTLDNDAVFALIGADPPKAWLEEMGITIVTTQEAGGAGGKDW